MIMAAAIAAVSIGYASYEPPKVDVVAGTTVQWTNDSVRRHTVTADDGSYDSGSLNTNETYEHTYGAPGTYGYYCRLHAGIVGEVDVRGAVIDAPSGAGSPGKPYPLHGEVASGIHSLTVEGDDGSQTTATVADDGSWSATVTPKTTTTYHALDSAPVTVLVVVFGVTVADHEPSSATVAVVCEPSSPSIVSEWIPAATSPCNG